MDEMIQKNARRAFICMITLVTWLEDDELALKIGKRVRDNYRNTLDDEGKAAFDLAYMAAEREG